MIFSLNINKVHYVAHTMCKHCFPLDNTLYLSTALKENRKHKNKILVCFCEMTTCSGQKRGSKEEGFLISLWYYNMYIRN